MGGHLSELLTLEPLILKYNSLIVTEKSPVTEYLKQQYEQVDYLKAGTRKHLFRYFFIFIYNILKSFKIFFKFKPDLIISTGTHTAVPMFYIAKLFGKKNIYIESFANVETKTLAGKIVEPITDKVVVQWEDMESKYKKSKYLGGVF